MKIAMGYVSGVFSVLFAFALIATLCRYIWFDLSGYGALTGSIGFGLPMSGLGTATYLVWGDDAKLAKAFALLNFGFSIIFATGLLLGLITSILIEDYGMSAAAFFGFGIPLVLSGSTSVTWILEGGLPGEESEDTED